MIESGRAGCGGDEERYRDMTDFEVNSEGCERTRYFARILLDHLPPWLDDEIRAQHLSILDWGCAEGEAVEALRGHFPENRVAGIDPPAEAVRKARGKFGESSFFHLDALNEPLPVDFDILLTSNVLQGLAAPWQAVRKLARHATRHLLVLVPFRGESPFDDSTIGTRIDPDFALSSARIIDCDRFWQGSQILLVYSR